MNSEPTSILCLDGPTIMRIADRPRLIDALADGFKALSRGDVQAPARPKIEVRDQGFTLGMLGWTPGMLISQKLVSVFHDNHKRGLASHQAVITLLDPETGAPVAILEGGSITALRTTAAAMVSVRALSRPASRIATVVGAGVQGVEHVAELGLVRPLDEIRLWSRSRGTAERVAAAAGHANVRAVVDLEAAVRSSDVICMTTGASSPVIDAAWVKPGAHVTSVGYAPPGTEVPAALIERALVFVETRSAFEPAPVGCAELAGRDSSTAAEMGEVLLGRKPGRSSDSQITLYKSMGNGMEDLVAANLIFAEARRQGLGQTIRL